MQPAGPSARVSLLTGRDMPVIGLGTWQLKNDTPAAVLGAIELGYRMVDTSGDYGTQPGIAEALRQSPVPRDELYIVTKVEEDEDAYESAKRQVGELGLAYADLILIHRPPRDGSAGVHLWQGLIRARSEGIARDIGVSNYKAMQMDELIEATEEPPMVNQIEWSPFGHSEAMRRYCQKSGIVIMAYSPITRGEKLGSAVLKGIASKHGKTPAQVVLRWNIERNTVPIPKANRREHQEENIGIFDFELDSQDLLDLDGLNERYSSLGKLPYE